jgi:triacylglycerol esterase/lipase EstA (alpha/beta hydrolase family)
MMMSVRWMTRILLLVQAAAALLIGWGLQRWGGMATGLALAGGFAAVAVVRLLINLNNFLLAACFASPTPAAFRLGPAARLRLAAEEFVASMLTTSWRMPRAVAGMRIWADSAAVPVLLVHGYGCNSGYWARLLPLLAAARTSHASVDLEPIGGDIDGYAGQLQQAVEQLCAASGAPQVAIVGHSMGGLVARAWMRAYGTGRLARLVTLGSPHHGTALAGFGPGVNAKQMRWSQAHGASAWLQRLAADEDPATRALVTSLWSHHDNIVAPQLSSVLPGARHIEFGGVGHVALGSNRRVLAEVMRELSELNVAVVALRMQ